MKRVLAALLALALCGAARADGGTMLAVLGWNLHGIAVSESGAPVGGGSVALWRGNVLIASKGLTSQAWQFSISETAGIYQIRYTPPAGWECVGVRSAGVGWQYPGGGIGQIALPEQAPSLGPDLVFVVRYVATPPPIPTIMPTATAVFTQTPTVTPTRLWPTDEPTLPQGTAVATPTPEVTATRPEAGWEPWQKPPQALAAMLMYEVEWTLDVLGPSRDPLQLAVLATYGPALPLGAPVTTHYSIANAHGDAEVYAVRWQLWAAPSGWVCAWSLETEPYRVALMRGGW